MTQYIHTLIAVAIVLLAHLILRRWEMRAELRRIVRQRVRFGYDYRTTKGRTF